MEQEIYVDTGEKKNCLSDEVYFLEKWSDILKDDTFLSTVVDFHLEEAEALCQYRDLARLKFFRVREGKDLTAAEVWGYEQRALVFGSLYCYPDVDVDENVTRLLKQVEDRLDIAIRDFGALGAFVKLNSRSPKDAPLLRPDFNDFLKKEVALSMQHSFEEGYFNDDILDSLSFFRAAGSSLIVRSGREAMFLLLQSARVYDDVKLYLQNFQTRNYNPLKLVIRKWENIDPVSEVRAFVVQNEIKVMTQYSPYYYFPDFANEARKDRLQAIILKYFEERIKPKVKPLVQDYTVDFAFSRECNHFDDARLWIVELNPPPPVAGTSLFRQSETCLKEGPFEFRVVTDEREALASVPRECLPLMKLYREEERKKKGCVLQ